MKRLLCASAIALVLAASPAKPSGIPVFDGANLAQNLITALQTIEMVANQIRSLQNEARMLENDARNLARLDFSALGALEGALRSINALMERARGIAFDVASVEAEFMRLYPREYAAAITTDALVADARSRWDQAMEAFRHTLLVQSEIVGQVRADTDTLSLLVSESQAAIGNLQAQQAANQLIAFLGKQLLQSQELMAAQYRAQAVQDARGAMSEEQARAQLQRFLGDASPRRVSP